MKNYRLASTHDDAVKIIDEQLLAVGLSYEEVATKYANEFSGGQLQRISISRALVTDPVLLIADEPVSMVDASLRMSIVSLFRELRDTYRVSVVYITHDLATAHYVGDRMAVRFRGDIIKRGPAADVLMHPQHPYTRLLRESIPQVDPERKWKSTVRLSDAESEDFQRTGCKFAGRCPHAMSACNTSMPEEYQHGEIEVRRYLYDARYAAQSPQPQR